MPQQTKIFRVFVSSTFTDMKEERRILQKDVFPKLEKFCESKGAKFQAVDLRWGVNEETQLDQKTLGICFNEVARCQKISPKPNFIILMGNRYGWQPAPEKITAEEMKEIHNALSGEDKELIEEWYRLDENAVPPEYVLKPRENKSKEYEALGKKEAETRKRKDYDAWKEKEREILLVLREAASGLGFSGEQNEKYFTSATHQEIIRGALNPPADGEKPEEHVFAFVRNIEGLPSDSTAEDFIDLDGDEEHRNYCAKQLKNLKQELEGKFGDHYVTYPATWGSKVTNIESADDNSEESTIQKITWESKILNTKDFSEKVYKFLHEIIQSQITDFQKDNDLIHEVNLHKEFKNKLTLHFHGRAEILEKIQQYIKNTSDKKVLSLIGESGTGKSSVMAKAIQQNERENAYTVYRFLGTTSLTSNVISLLRNLCEQIAKEYGIEKLESLAGEGKEKSLYEMQGLSEVFKKCLALASAERPLVIFLDAIDQLSESDNARSLYWIPRDLPDHVRIVISSTPEMEKYLTATHKEELSILSKEEAMFILNTWLEASNRKLTKDQSDFVIKCFNKKGLPLYLKLAFESAKHWHSYDKDISLKEDVNGIIEDFFKMLEHEHKEEFVKNVVCYMLCGRYQGLAENEILEILVFDEDYWKKFLKSTHKDHRQELIDMKEELKGSMKIPIVVWSRLFLDLEPFLTERDADGIPIITFFHRQFIEVLKEKYGLKDENIKI